MKNIHLKIMSLILFIFCMTMSVTSYAVAFSVGPKAGTTFPTQLIPGSTVAALYTVTNTTLRTLLGSFVGYTPLNTQQIMVDSTYPDLCGATFDLASGASCTLELSVSGPVDPNDPDPRHHLFICNPNIPACSGTDFPLSVSILAGPSLISITIIPLNELLAIGGTLQFTAIANYSDGSTADITNSVNWSSSNTAAVTIGDRTGLATGVGTGSTTITVSSDNITSTTTLIIKPQFSYIANNGGSVSICPVNADGSFGTCSSFVDATFSNPKGIVLNSLYTYAYVADFSGNKISICPVNSNGSLTVCTSYADASFNGPQGITINSNETYLYVSNQHALTVSICALSPDGGTIGPCTATTGNGTISGATSVVLNSTNTIAYVTNFGNSTISICPVNTTTGGFGTCTTTAAGGTINKPVGTIINSTNTFAYTTNNHSATPPYTVSICALNADGTFGACTISNASSTLNLPEGIGLNAANTFLYITNQGTNAVSICPVNGGTLGTCSISTGGGAFNLPFSAYIH
jgi:6-phosphogluconolactonase (cycloisomerase 2 family)